MKVVLFCGGLGTRIREYSESIPKPMIPIGHQPILWHVMQYYSQYGHTRLRAVPRLQGQHHQGVLPQLPAARLCRLRRLGLRQEGRAAGRAAKDDWRVTLVDTGIWRNIGERLWAVREHVKNEEMFLANYSDGLTDVNLDDMVEHFKKSGKIACFLAVRPPLTFHLADIDETGRVRDFRTSDRSDIWINGGYFMFRREIFDYMREGEELVLEPFQRLIEEDQLMAYKYEGFWRAMDTLRDRQILEDMVEQGKMPWRIQNGQAGAERT